MKSNAQRKAAEIATRREIIRQDLAEISHVTTAAADAMRWFARAVHDICRDQIEALELGFKPSFSRSRRLHKKLVKKALARGAAHIV